jgi:hypothetical protein
MKVNAINILFISFLVLSLSCQHTQIIQKEILQDGKFLQIETFTFRYKGERVKQISSIIKNDGKIVSSYNISTKCGCVGKTEYIPRITHYKLTINQSFDLPLNETDKLVFKKFASLPQIETYCSKNLLDSAKGFIKD